MRLMNFTQDLDLLQAVRLAAPGEASTAVLFTASYPDGGSEQVSMGNDVQMYVRLAVKNLRRFGHRPMVLTEAKAAARLCGGIAIVETQTICGFQDAIAPHERWRAVGVTSRHYYVLFLQRWRLIARTLRLGYSMLSLDTDIYWSADPLAVATAALPGVGVAVAVDQPPPLPPWGASRGRGARIPLNSGVMLARPGKPSSALFEEVVRRVHSRLMTPPRGQRHGGLVEAPRIEPVWPQLVLNQVVEEWRRTPWRPVAGNSSRVRGKADTQNAQTSGVATVGAERLQLGVLGHYIVSRICGRRLSPRDSVAFWKRAEEGGHCTLARSQLGFHAQMVHPRTRAALWAINHPDIRARKTLFRAVAAADARAANVSHGLRGRPPQGFEMIAMSSTMTGYTCICRADSACRVLAGTDSHRVAVKRCSSFSGANPEARR